MGNFVIGQLLRWIGRKLDGHRTAIGGIGLILTGISGGIGYVYPDIEGLPRMDIEVILGFISAGIAIVGGGGKQEKTKDEIKRLLEALEQRQQADSGRKDLGL